MDVLLSDDGWRGVGGRTERDRHVESERPADRAGATSPRTPAGSERVHLPQVHSPA